VVRQVRIIMNDEDYEKLQRLKGNKTWRDFIFDLVDFKQKMEQEGEFVPRDSLREPYVIQAQALRKLGSLLKVVWKDEKGKEYRESWELEAAALLPLYVSEVELKEEEKRELFHLIANVLKQLVSELYPDLSEQFKWLSQGLLFLAKDRMEIYEVSIENFIEEFRKGSKIP